MFFSFTGLIHRITVHSAYMYGSETVVSACLYAQHAYKHS